MSTFRLDLHPIGPLFGIDKVTRVNEIIGSFVSMPGIQKQNQVNVLAAFLMKNTH